MIRRFLIAFLLVIFTIGAHSQIVEPVKWSFSQNKISEKEFELVFTARIVNRLYWKRLYQLPENGGQCMGKT